MGTPNVSTLVAGEWIEGDSWVDVGNPADLGNPVARVPSLGPDEVVAAYDAAESASSDWRRAGAHQRAEVMRVAGALLRERVEDIAGSITDENGKPLAESRGEVIKSAEFLEYYASFARSGYGTLLHDVRPGTRARFQREPLGVVLAITPWNDPLLTPARKLSPALIAGNTVVLKPASDTPQSALHLARALADAGLPDGVLSVITGPNSRVGDALVDDTRIAAVSFTGSNAVGEGLRARVAARNVRFQGELGGKNASVVLSDANLDVAVAGVVASSFGGSGQRCTATSRVIVDAAVAEAFTARLVGDVEALVVGPGRAEGTQMGPVVSPSQRESVLGFVDRAVAAGATVLAGGGPPTDALLDGGCYVAPTVIADVTTDMEIWRDEVFGPVVVVHVVDGVRAAIDAVNDSVFGLSAAVYTDSLAAAELFIDQVDCGQVAVNTSTSGWDVHYPFGGFRSSGSPFKEQGEEALRFYTRVKTVAIHAPGGAA